MRLPWELVLHHFTEKRGTLTNRTVSRRAFLKRAGVATLGIGLGACAPVEIPLATGSEANEEPAAANAVSPRPAEEDFVEFPITVEYFTPAQTEGPYYPVQKLEDRDNDLFFLDGGRRKARR